MFRHSVIRRKILIIIWRLWEIQLQNLLGVIDPKNLPKIALKN